MKFRTTQETPGKSERSSAVTYMPAYIPGDGPHPDSLRHGEVAISPGNARAYRGPILNVLPDVYLAASLGTDADAEAATPEIIAHQSSLLAGSMAELSLGTDLKPLKLNLLSRAGVYP